MTERISLLANYFRQQGELGVSPHIFSDSTVLSNLFPQKKIAPAAKIPIKTNSASSHGFTGYAPKSPINFQAKPVSKQTALPHLASKLFAPATVKPSAISGKRAELADFFHQVKTCQNCGLGQTRKNFVFGTGNPDALLMVIGEAPGEEEDAQGQPFVGAAGALLTKMLSAINIDRKTHAFIANILKCRPPGNRNPEPTEISACSSILAGQIDIIAPKVILLLGRIAAHTLLNSVDSISKLRTAPHEYHGIPVFVTYHPAAVLRNNEYRRPTWEDLQKLQLTLKNLGVYDA